MKRIFFSLIIFTLLTGCAKEPANWIAISAETNETTTFHYQEPPYKCWVKTSVNEEISFSVFLLPESKKNMNITSVSSTNEDVASIIFSDLNNGNIQVKANKKGESNIVVKTKSFGSTSMYIYVN